MEERKYKIKFIIIVLVLTIISALLGTSYALLLWNSENNTELTIRIGDVAGVYFKTGNNINISNLGPVFDCEKDGESTYFTISNYSNEEITLDANFNITNITSNLKEESFKYVVMSSNDNTNYKVIKEDNFVNVNNNDVIPLFQELKLLPNSTISYKLIIYIDGNMLNPTTMQNGSLNGNITVSEHVYNLDTSGANVPELTDNLVPVMYNGTTWVVADSENMDATYQWYDYDNKMWANAVFLTETKRNSLTKTGEYYTPGQTIGDSESSGVLAFYVWIPRYKYKVWNKDKIMGTDSYDAETKGIDIVFEKGVETTGTITCTYSFAAPSSNAGSPNETCTGNNGDYYTHPAFKFGNDNITGLWVGKFELTYTSGTPAILPNLSCATGKSVTSNWKVIDDMQTSNNAYGLTTDHTNADSHMITNMEWGSITYLAHSKYGRCNGNSCTKVEKNSSSKTGCGPESSGNTCNAYTSTLGLTASTTANVYGAYDMNGGTYEYVMGNASSEAENYTYNESDADSYYTYSGNEKYVTTYAYGTSDMDQTAYNRGRLGDATSEVISENSYVWHSNSSSFFIFSNFSWFTRGSGNYNSSDSSDSMFYISNDTGISFTGYGTRASLIIFSE